VDGSDPKKAAERHYGVGDLPGRFVDHQSVSRADLLALSIVDLRAIDLVRGNQVAGFVGLYGLALLHAMSGILHQSTICELSGVPQAAAATPGTLLG
jgi:hypothetical protein